MDLQHCASLSDAALLAAAARVAADARRSTAELIALLAEMDTRRLYLDQGYPSLFMYCTRVLHLSEYGAYDRIEVARASRKFPVLLNHLVEGDLTLTTARLLAPHLSAENHLTVLAAARHKSKRDVELLVATLAPRPDIASVIRRLPAPAAWSRHAEAPGMPSVQSDDPPTSPHGTPQVAPMQRRASAPATVAPLSPSRYTIKVTVSAEAHNHLRRAQDLLRHTLPNGDPAAIVERALALLVAHLERRRFADVAQPRTKSVIDVSTSRHIPAAVRRAVWRRDGGQCVFSGSGGKCGETSLLEFHHLVPFAAGGPTTQENLELRCRPHNQHEARLFFGEDVIRPEPREPEGRAPGNR